MKHYGEEELILYHYGEREDGEYVARHLASCEPCRREYESLLRLFTGADAVPVPSRSETYPSQLWHSLQPRLERSPRRSLAAFFTFPRLAFAGSAAVLLVLAFLVGRWSGPSPTGEMPQQARERILLVAVSDHLQRSERLLIELGNANGSAGVDISEYQVSARTLADASRLYRHSAGGTGRDEIVDLLEELERFLQEVANAPSELAYSDLAGMQRRLAGRGLVLRVRLLEQRARNDAGWASPRPTSFERDSRLEL